MQIIPIKEGTTKYNPEPEFKSKLFDCCFEPKIAVLACICPGFVQGQNSHDVTDGQFGCCVQGSMLCFATLIAPYAVGGVNADFRGTIRKYMGISGSKETDCLVHCFCHPCALVQEYREIKYRKTQGYLYINAPGHVYSCECKRCSAPPAVQMQ